MHAARACFALLVLAACSSKNSARLIDGGLFEVPDSGFSFDARALPPDVGPPVDAGPFVCDAGCPDGSYCGCIETPIRRCGCQERGGFIAHCDPLVPMSCRWPYECARARKVDGVYFLCSDGREGTPCSPADDICSTARGCVCLSTPIGFGCSCQGASGPNPLYCNRQRPETCPEGTCVHVDAPGGGFDICSSGGPNEPCNPGDQTCHTSLGCTCPLVAGRESCRCSEPGTVAGEACDPRVTGACTAPLRCVVYRGEGPNEFYTECAGGGASRDGGTDPFGCDPMMPLCPTGYSCEEIAPNQYRCVPDR